MNLRIRDLIEIPPVKTVIRLEEGRTQSHTITSSFVCTSDVTGHLNVLATSISRKSGTGCFIEGDFGSGKSHFLAALSVWLDNRPGAELLSNANPALGELRKRGCRFLPVEISLVEYRSSTPLERIITSSIEKSFIGCGIEAVLSPMRRFTSNLKTILHTPSTALAFHETTGVRALELDGWFEREPKEAFSKSLAFLKSIGVESPESLIEERNEVFSRAMALVRESGFDGMVLLIDELSEFFRSKPDPAALNEDARTLQLLGEIAGTNPLWIIAAVQESIERTGDIASVTFRKIKDRFPMRLHLSTLHIRDLISGRLVKHKEGAGETIREIHAEYRKIFPLFKVSFDQFRSVYPLHPVTLSLLEGLGELFSQHRGIVDFVHSRIAGDPSRAIQGILDNPANELLAPDALYEHFKSRLAEISAFHDFPRRIIPHLDEVIEKVIDDPEDRTLALRLVRILVLYAIHPTAKPPTAQLLTELCACMFAPHDPVANVQFITSAVLDPLLSESRFIYKKVLPEGNSSDAVYGISASEDIAGNLQARIRQAMSEIRKDDSRLVLEPLSTMGIDLSWPGPDILRGPVTRIVMWRQSIRRAVIAFVFPGSEAALAARISEMFRLGEAEMGFVLTTGSVKFELENTMVWRFCAQGADHTVLTEYFATLTVARELHTSNPAHAPLVTPVADRLKRLEPVVRQTVVDLIYEGDFDGAGGIVDKAALHLKRFDRLLEYAAERILDKKYPRFREIAPRQPASNRMYQGLIDKFVIPGTLSMSEARVLGLIEPIETLVVPLGLVELKSGSYRLAPALGEHPFLTYMLSLVQPSGPTSMKEFMQQLGSGPWGVPQETVEFLLVTLAQCGIVALQRQGRTVSLDLMPMTALETVDSIVPGELISHADRDTLINECAFCAPPGGWPSFGLRQQRDAWQALIKFKNSMESILLATARQSGAVDGYSAFSSFDFTSLRAKGDTLAIVLQEIKVSWHAREGIERFCGAWRTSGLDNSDIDMLRKAHRFFVHFADKFIFIAHYLRNQSVENACCIDPDTEQRRKAVQVMLDDPLTFVVSDEGAQIGAAFELFRECYGSLYKTKHHEHHAAKAAPILNRSQERIVSLLERLSAIEQIEQPIEVETLLKSVRGTNSTVCNRSIAEEMLRSPVCGCGYQIELEAEASPRNEAMLSIDEAFKLYQVNLGTPEILEAVTAHAFALRDMDRTMADRLDRLCSVLRDSTVASRVVLDILDETTIRELERALSGSMKVQSRSIVTLFDELCGKRLTPGRVRRIVEQWVGQLPDNVILSIDGKKEKEGAQRPSWWPSLHPGLIDDSSARIPDNETQEIENSLEKEFPSDLVRKKLHSADCSRLVRFITAEPFHTHAIRAVWLLLVKKILKNPGELWPENVPCSCHVDPRVADAINDRIALLDKTRKFSMVPFPEQLRTRTGLSALWIDEWATAETRKMIEECATRLEKAADDWLRTLPVQPVIDLDSKPVVLLFDALSADCWMEAMNGSSHSVNGARQEWFRISCAPETLASLGALFGFDDTIDPTDSFAHAGALYVTFRGDEDRLLTDQIPPLDSPGAVVIRLNLIDNAAHGGKLPLSSLSGIVSTFLERHLPSLRDACVKSGRKLVLTADHGLSWSKGALTHGSGGVFEKTVIRVEWE